MLESSAVAAIVHASDNQVAIWWTAIGTRDPGFSRLCGAWVLERGDRVIAELLDGKHLVCTDEGSAAIAEVGVSAHSRLDLERTVGAIRSEIDRLDALYSVESKARAKAKLVRPSWPALSDWASGVRGELTDAPLSRDAVEQVALKLATRVSSLCRVWDEVENQRLSRPWMTVADGNERRPIPAVIL